MTLLAVIVAVGLGAVVFFLALLGAYHWSFRRRVRGEVLDFTRRRP